LPAVTQRSTALDRALRGSAITGVGLCLLWVAGLVWFATPPPTDSRLSPTDAIVVLTGGSLRLRSGIDLMLQGKGRLLFVSGVSEKAGLDDLLRETGGDPPRWLACCIVIGHEAKDTMGNALETAHWMRRQGYHSLRLVTSWYHMPRSLLEFRRAMPPDVEIVPHPVFSHRVEAESWWAWRGTAALLIGEYAKYLATLIRPLFGSPQPIGLEPLETERRR
jgi:uncharacterized SAM-binding protein YcdF (DUF218 family)